MESRSKDSVMRALEEAQKRDGRSGAQALAPQLGVWVLPSGRVLETVTGEAIGQLPPVWVYLNKEGRLDA